MLGIAAVFAFYWFWETNPRVRLWWLKTPSSHALLFGTIAFTLEFFDYAIPWDNSFAQFSGMLLFVTGFGYAAFVLLKNSFTNLAPAAIIFIHLFGGAAGTYLFLQAFSTMINTLIPLLLLMLYLTVVGKAFLKKSTYINTCETNSCVKNPSSRGVLVLGTKQARRKCEQSAGPLA